MGYSDFVITYGDDTAGTAHHEGVILALQRATHGTLRLLAARLADEDLAASEINALASLADGRVRSVGELAADTGTKPTTLTSVLDRLTRRGLVTRETDQADRRSFLVDLTDEGRRVARAARAAMTDIEAEALSAVGPADLTGFYAVTSALAEASR